MLVCGFQIRKSWDLTVVWLGQSDLLCHLRSAWQSWLYQATENEHWLITLWEKRLQITSLHSGRRRFWPQTLAAYYLEKRQLMSLPLRVQMVDNDQGDHVGAFTINNHKTYKLKAITITRLVFLTQFFICQMILKNWCLGRITWGYPILSELAHLRQPYDLSLEGSFGLQRPFRDAKEKCRCRWYGFRLRFWHQLTRLWRTAPTDKKVVRLGQGAGWKSGRI